MTADEKFPVFTRFGHRESETHVLQLILIVDGITDSVTIIVVPSCINFRAGPLPYTTATQYAPFEILSRLDD
jgi:hypothetical protein